MGDCHGMGWITALERMGWGRVMVDYGGWEEGINRCVYFMSLK